MIRAWLNARSRAARLWMSVGVCLLVGVIVALALAWAEPVVTALRKTGGVTYSKPSESFMFRDEEGREFEAIVTRRALSVGWILDPKDWQIGPGARRLTYPPDGLKPWWVPWPMSGKMEGISISGFGFPFPALVYTMDRHYTADWSQNPPRLATSMDAHGVWMLRVGEAPYQVAYLPTRVFWAGSLGDCFLVAAVLWIPLFGVRRLRAWRWGRRGACWRCGYDRKGLGRGEKCPECGVAGVC
jgi:hypothetical protein